MVDRSLLMRQVFGKLVNSAKPGSQRIHILSKLVPDPRPLQDTVDNAAGGRLVVDETMFDLLGAIAIPERVDV